MASLPRIEPYPLPLEHELPAPRPAWRIDASRAALLIHDMQRYFIRAFPAGESPAAPLLAHIAALRAACRARQIPVFYTAQPGAQPRSTRGLQADFWGPGMSDSAADRDIVEALAPEPPDVVLTKRRYSAFVATDFEAQLRARGRDQLIVTGVYSHIGCLFTAADAFMRDIEPFFVADAVAAFSRRDHDLAIANAAGSCACVLSTRAVMAVLAQAGAPSANSTISIETLRADVAAILDVAPSEILDTDNLIDFGLDSIRLMSLVQKWNDAGLTASFSELAEWPELKRWHARLTGDRS